MKREWEVIENDLPKYWPPELSSEQKEGLKMVRKALRVISARNPGISFKTDAKSSCVWIRAMKAENGRQRTIASAKAALSILDDVLTMESGAFRARLEAYLRKKGFQL